MEICWYFATLNGLVLACTFYLGKVSFLMLHASWGISFEAHDIKHTLYLLKQSFKDRTWIRCMQPATYPQWHHKRPPLTSLGNITFWNFVQSSSYSWSYPIVSVLNVIYLMGLVVRKTRSTTGLCLLNLITRMLSKRHYFYFQGSSRNDSLYTKGFYNGVPIGNMDK